ILPHELVAGGETRFHSVKNGLDKISSGLVMVHDGVRPLVSADTIKNVLAKATESGAAIPCVAVSESLRMKQDNQTQVVDRSKFMLVQTPQCFSYELMHAAFQQEYSNGFTDCASVIEAAGHSVSVVEGNQSNIKITHPADLIFAEAILQSNRQ
ncbi:MAG: 2-C-methyl-D-erythritol 4-phosphate cytidylyltransferase, partial [Bacteroidetes bacterium]|nr:2-C-methyl-D-erythritol 4-phosphate cytidylyltransferase [Bacteroidota bacterium]